MKKIIYLILLLNTMQINAQVPNLEWFNPIRISSDGNDDLKRIRSVKIDKDGSIIVSGVLYGSFEMGGVPYAPSVPLSNYNVFVVKMNQDSTIQWVKKIQGEDTYLRDMKLDNDGNIYLTGNFYSPNIDFDPGPGIVTVATSQYNNYILKLDKNGDFQWVKRLRCTSQLYGGEMNIDNWGNIYLSGAFRGAMTFSGNIAKVIDTNNTADLDFYMIKLDTAGEHIWSKTLRGNVSEFNIEQLNLDDKEIYTAIVPDNLGNIYFAANFRDSIDLDPGGNGLKIIANYPNYAFSPLIAKYDSAGTVQWGKKLGQTGGNYIVTMNLDNSNNIIMVGGFHGNTDFNPDIQYSDILSPPNDPLNKNTYILKLTSAGVYIWAKPFYGHSYSIYDHYLPSDFCVDRDNNIYITGFLNDRMDFDTGFGINLGLGAINERVGYVAKLDINGNLAWYNLHTTYPKYPKPANYNQRKKYGSCIAVDSSYNVFTGGSIGDTIDVDYGPLTRVFISDPARLNAYIQKHKQCQPSPVTTTVTATTLTANQTGSKYQWVYCDSAYTPIAGATSQTFTPSDGGNYAVVVSINNCSDVSPCTMWWPVGINNYDENKLSVYPNPVNDIATILFNETEQNISLSLCDISGRTIEQYKFTNTSQLILSMKDMALGIYVLHVKTKNWQRQIKLIKEN